MLGVDLMLKKWKKTISIPVIYGFLFVLIIFGIGAVNIKKVMDFWMNDKVDYNEWNVTLGSKTETDYISNFWEKMQFVNLNGFMCKLLGQHEMNGVVKLKNGYLVTTYPYASNEMLQEKANNLYALDSRLKERNISMLYAMCPYTSSKWDSQMPLGVEDYGNENMDRFMGMISEYGIENIDFREEMYADGIDQYDMMYKTDHHWTTQAGFYAYTKLLDWIQEKTDCKVDENVKEISNYQQTTYKNWHLGSRGQRTGIYYAGIDDFILITPDFETSISNGTVEGSFKDLIIDESPLRNREYTSRYTYDYVLGNALGNYTNNFARNDVKVLVITDSFGKAVNPYLILSFKEVQWCVSMQEITEEYIDGYKPDVVIVMYYANAVCEDNVFFSFNNF